MLSGETMGTSWRASVIVPDGVRLRAVQAGVEAALDAVVAEMSQWEPGSDISRFNRAEAGAWRVLPPAFFAVLEHGVALAEASGGAYDPTHGRLTDLWGFGPQPAAAPPDDEAIGAGLDASGWQRLAIDRERRAVRQPGGLALDLSSIAKGYGVDMAAAALRAAGVGNFLIEVGGELFGKGVKADGTPWWVEIEQPPGAALRPTMVALYGLAIATSGDYRRFNDFGSHTIDPRTGRPVVNGLASVTVLSASAMEADALATALTVLGAEDGRAFAKARGVAAMFVEQDGEAFRETMTPAMGAMLS